MNDDCGFLIYEVTGGRTLSFPINNQQSSLNSRQFFPLVAIPGSAQKSAVPLMAAALSHQNPLPHSESP
jgi:hypothetical protein